MARIGHPPRITRLPVDTFLKECQSKIERSNKTKYTGYSKCEEAGSKKVQAFLGPLQYQEKRSDAVSTLPSGITQARSTYGDMFKAGHMLNATLGGSGSNHKNMTIITNSANVAMNTFDTKAKQAVHDLAKLFRIFHRAKAMPNELSSDYIDFFIEVSSDKWEKSTAPGCYICNRITLSATYKPTMTLKKLTNWKANTTSERLSLAREYEQRLEKLQDSCHGACGDVDNTH